MPKRQLILLILMGLAVVYAGVDFLTSGSKAGAPAEATSQELDTLKQQALAMLASQKLSEVEKYRISLLDEQDAGDPLLKHDPDSEGAMDLTARTGDSRFTYSAYLRFGDLVLGVLNNEECALGDPVADTGYTLTSLTKDAATVQGTNPESGQPEKVLIPIQEDIITFPEQSKKPAEEADAKN